MKALFLDRDGVINVDVNYGYRIDQMQFLPGIFDFTRKFSDAGYAIVIVTNQGGIGRGFYTEADFHLLTDWMRAQFASEGVTITSVKFCPHHPEAITAKYQLQCACRKPEPGMLKEAIAELKLDPAQSIMVGDRATDMHAGHRAGVGHLYLLGEKSEWLALDSTMQANVIRVENFDGITFAPER
jgi:D-glycero-D-manno-heptose 1,7-bisphosphate phosphatase